MKVWFPVIRGGSGTDVFTLRLAEALKRRGITAEITWFSTHYQFAPFLLRSVPAPPATEIIHANSWNGFAFKRVGIPLVVTEHLNVLDPLYGPYKSWGQSLYHETLIRRYVAASYRAASAVTAVSRFTAEGLTRLFGISAQVIYNSINTKAFSPQGAGRDPVQRPFRLLFIGNLSRRKGADLLDPILRELGPQFELYFTSGLRGPKMKFLAQNMVPIGRLTKDIDLIRAYHKCDALLFPTRFEGLPLAPLEAMACGRPVVATGASSLPEIIEDGVSGILCPTNDISAFVEACRKLADHPQILRDYGLAARSRVEGLFSKELIIPQYIALYQRLVGGMRRGA